MKHITIASVLALLLTASINVSAQSETGSKMQELILELRTQHQELSSIYFSEIKSIF